MLQCYKGCSGREGYTHSVSFSFSVFSHKEHTLCNRKERRSCPKRVKGSITGQWIHPCGTWLRMCLAVTHSCAWRGRAQRAAGPWELVCPAAHEGSTLLPLPELGQVSLSGLGDADICALVYPQPYAKLFWWGTDRVPHSRHRKCCLCAEAPTPRPRPVPGGEGKQTR